MITNNRCPSCDSKALNYDESFDFWTCESCGEVWSEGLNDPDCDDDCSAITSEAAEQNIELINQWQPKI